MKTPFTLLVELCDGEVVRLSGTEKRVKALTSSNVLRLFKAGWVCADDKASFNYLFPSKDYNNIRTEQV